MEYALSKFLHLGGMFFLFVGLAGLAFLPSEDQEGMTFMAGRFARFSRILGLLLILGGGLGMLHALGMFRSGIPKWALAKLGIFILFGPAVALVKRAPLLALSLFLVLGLAAGYLAVFKPF
ncbi:MAG: hypothetical protein JNM63_01090 [Spirochaetia bacterium]|nr:hypothetical protein [Spirochaetia bacterium]